MYKISVMVFPKSVSKHFAQHHAKDPSGLKFWAIEKLKPHWRASHEIRELSKNESKWIFISDFNYLFPIMV